MLKQRLHIMKLSYCLNFLIILLTYFLANHANAVTVSEQLPKQKAEQLIKVNSLNELPAEINHLLYKKYGRVADIGERFNSSCIINFEEPSVGLKTASIDKHYAILNIAIGGFAMRYVKLIFIRDESGWHLQNE